MVSSFHGVELGKKGLLAHQAALNTTGHNLSNVSNPSYSRQKVQMSTAEAIHPPGINVSGTTAGQIGGGSVAEDISRVRDSFLEGRIIEEKGSFGYWEHRDFFLKQVEGIYNEPDTPSLQARLELFINSWNALANSPQEGGAREVLKNEGISLTGYIRNTFDKLFTLRDNADKMLVGKVSEINVMSKQIARLNSEIGKIRAEGRSPNDLLDRRDLLVEELSVLVPVRVGEDRDEFIVYIGSDRLVQGDKYESLLARKDIDNDGFSKVLWSRTLKELVLKNGELSGLVAARDVDIKGQIEALDTFSINLLKTVNEIHRDGFGLNLRTGVNFFAEKYISENVNGDYDSNGDGFLDSTALYEFRGRERLSGSDLIGTNGVLNIGVSGLSGVSIDYFASDTVYSLIDRINKSDSSLLAYLNHEGNLTLKSSDNRFMIDHIEDSGNFLVGFAGILRESGEGGSFDSGRTGEVSKLFLSSYTRSPYKNPSSWISVDRSILREVQNIAAARGKDSDGDGRLDRITGEGDGRNALRIVAVLRSENKAVSDRLARIDQDPVMIDKHSRGFHSFLNNMVRSLGSYARTADMEFKKEEAIVHNLVNMREGISGVNVDEEMASLVMYQHGYNASARFVTYIDRMLDTIINRMGV